MNYFEQKLPPILETTLSSIKSFYTKIGLIKAQIFDFLRLQCLIPTILQPYKPVLIYIRCLLGLNSDSSIKVPSGRSIQCSQTENEVREITRHLNVNLNQDFTNLRVRTTADCFPNQKKIRYGARILAKLVDDESCDDIRYQSICDTLLNENRVVMIDSCNSER